MTAAHGVLDMPHFDIVLHAVIPNLEPTLRKRLRTIHESWNCPKNHICRQKHFFSKTKVFFHQQCA